MSKYHFYTNGIKTIRVYDGQQPPEGFHLGYLRDYTAWNKGKTADSDERVRNNVQKVHESRKKNGNYVAWNKGLTKETCTSLMSTSLKLSGENNPMFGVHREAWNKGLSGIKTNNKGGKAWNSGKTHEDDDRIKCVPRSEVTKQKIKLSHSSIECKQKRFSTMKNNGNLGKNKFTKAEQTYYQKLLQIYSEDDILTQYFDERYPFACDFYIKSIDRFIELNACWTHGGRPFDPTNEECCQKLDFWKEKAKESKYYQNAIYTWTDLDVRKRNIALKNNLNIEFIYS